MHHWPPLATVRQHFFEAQQFMTNDAINWMPEAVSNQRINLEYRATASSTTIGLAEST